VNAAPIEPVRWTPRRWLYAIASVFLAQLALILFFSESLRRVPHGPQFRTAINLAVDPASEQKLSQLPALSDPTLSALPNLHGFSGAAWLIFPPMQHQFTDWTNSAHWLEIDAGGLGKTFLSFVRSNTTAPLLIADKPLPSLTGPRLLLTNQPLAEHSEVRIEGELAGRQLLNPMPLRSWPYSEILTNTEVQLLVDVDGETLPATLLSSCGYADADQYALKVAANSRFQPLRGKGGTSATSGQVTWGKMIFQWHTTLPASASTLSSGP
jgi:hypothetical protein